MRQRTFFSWTLCYMDQMLQKSSVTVQGSNVQGLNGRRDQMFRDQLSQGCTVTGIKKYRDKIFSYAFIFIIGAQF
jgi:hypothetical protein